MSGTFLGVGINFPLQVDSRGNLGYAYYHESIKQSIQLILGTSKGERAMRPDFGCEINDLVFSPNNTNTRSLLAYYIEEALVKWEPRIILEKVEAQPDVSDEARINIQIEYKVREINTYFNQVYPFYLERGESDTQSQFG